MDNPSATPAPQAAVLRPSRTVWVPRSHTKTTNPEPIACGMNSVELE